MHKNVMTRPDIFALIPDELIPSGTVRMHGLRFGMLGVHNTHILGRVTTYIDMCL